MKKFAFWLFITVVVLSIAYFLGPRPTTPEYSTLLQTIELKNINEYVKSLDSGHKIKPGNEAELQWNGRLEQTEYAIVYLHGFSASKQEGNPVDMFLAKALHANLFLSRLSDHGIDTIAPMQYLTADKLWESGKQALSVGTAIGKKVILVGTSTGGTLALKLAATYPNLVHAVILISPNIAINDPNAFLLNDPWGLQIARTVIGGKERMVAGKSDEYKKYWYTNYRLESVVELEQLMETSMNVDTYAKVKQPVLMLYYYKNKQEQDPVVRVDAMLKMFDELGTPENQKLKVAIPNGGSHVLGSYVTSKDIPAVEAAMIQFLPKLQ